MPVIGEEEGRVWPVVPLFLVAASQHPGQEKMLLALKGKPPKKNFF